MALYFTHQIRLVLSLCTETVYCITMSELFPQLSVSFLICLCLVDNTCADIDIVLIFFIAFIFFPVRVWVCIHLHVCLRGLVCVYGPPFPSRPEFCRSVAADSGSKPLSKSDMIGGPTAACAAS